MSCILHIETSTSACSVAVSEDGQNVFKKRRPERAFTRRIAGRIRRRSPVICRQPRHAAGCRCRKLRSRFVHRAAHRCVYGKRCMLRAQPAPHRASHPESAMRSGTALSR